MNTDRSIIEMLGRMAVNAVTKLLRIWLRQDACRCLQTCCQLDRLKGGWRARL